MAKEKPEYTLVLTQKAALAANNALAQEQPKGREALRSHSRCSKAVNEKCFTKLTFTQQGQTIETMQAKDNGGEIVLDEDRLKYLKKIAEQLVDQGKIPGSLSEGYQELLDLIDEAESRQRELEKALREAEKATEQVK